jgi:hypothetical protein
MQTSVCLNVPFKAQCLLYVPPALTVNNSEVCICGFIMIISVNREYYLKQH